MDAMKVTQQMIAFQKQSFNNFQSIWELTQTQTSSAAGRLMDQALPIPAEGRQALENWRTLMKQARERFSAYVDRSFAIYEKMLDAPRAATPAKTKKTNDVK